jgi:hypothetical protein
MPRDGFARLRRSPDAQRRVPLPAGRYRVRHPPPRLMLQAPFVPSPPLVEDAVAQADTRAIVRVPPHSGHLGVAGLAERDAASSSNRVSQSQHWYSYSGMGPTQSQSQH